MTTIDVKNTSGKKAGSAELAASVFEIELRLQVLESVPFSAELSEPSLYYREDRRMQNQILVPDDADVR